MRIGIDIRFMRPGKVGGTEVYVRRLVEAVLQLGRPHQYFLLTNDENAHCFAWDEPDLFQGSGNWYGVRNVDAWLFPGTAILPHRRHHCRVVVVHDVQHLDHPRFFTLRERLRRWRRERPSILRAEQVIAVSEFTRQALIRHEPRLAGKVTVIHSGVSDVFFEVPSPDRLASLRQKYALPPSFLLYPARFWPHKNHIRLYEALSILRAQLGKPCDLVLCGESAAGPFPEGVHSLGYLPEEDLRVLYRAAEALIFPSLYEGFGLPVLEAMASECPVVCSDAAALREVAGPAAYSFDPTSPASIAGALNAVLSDSRLRTELVEKGRARARQYSWLQTAGRTLDLLETASHG